MNDDRTFTLKAKYNDMLTINGQGTWTADDKQLTQTATELKVDGVPPQFKSQVDPIINGLLNKPQTGPFKWNSDDEFTWTRDGQMATFTRIKKS